MASPHEPNVGEVANRLAQNIMESQTFARFMPTDAAEFEGMNEGAVAVIGLLMWQLSRLQVILEHAGIAATPPPPGSPPQTPGGVHLPEA